MSDSVTITFPDVCLRPILEYLKTIMPASSAISLIYSKTGLRIIESNPKNTQVHNYEFDGCEITSSLLEYDYQSDKETLVFPVKAESLYQLCKGENKSAMLQIMSEFNSDGSPRKMDVIGACPVIGTIQPQEVKLSFYEDYLSKYDGIPPNHRVTLSEFSKMFAKVTNTKCKAIRVNYIAENETIVLSSIGGLVAINISLDGGKTVDVPPNCPSIDISLDDKNCEWTSKIARIATSSTVGKFFFRPGLPFVITSPISCYGLAIFVFANPA